MESPELQSQGGNVETPNQKQARLRRERREAKIKAGGSARLEKITNLSGRQNLPDLPPPAGPASTATDPDEVDLSTHPSASHNSGTDPTKSDIRALLRSGAPQPGVDTQPQGAGNEDPMVKMLSQLMGGMPGAGGQSGGEGEAGLSPGLAAMLGASGMAGPNGQSKQKSTYDYIWKIIHALFALLLGIYVTATSPSFTGQITRGSGVIGETPERDGTNLFWMFATAELVLQSGRFFLERGRSESQLGGWMGIVGGLLPEPWKGWIQLVGRYSGIWSTIVEDGMVVVFVVGVVSWWKGAVV